MTPNNHALQRTAAGHRGCHRRASWPPSLSLGLRCMRSALLTLLVINAALLVSCTASRNQHGNYAHMSNDQLIDLLPSPVPPLYKAGDPSVPSNAFLRQLRLHPRYSEVQAELLRRSRDAWPDLARHLDDQRYCMSTDDAQWTNWTVGDECYDLICLQVETYQGCLSGSKHSVNYLSRTVGRDRLPEWIKAHSHVPLVEIRLQATDWAISKTGGRDQALVRYRQELLQDRP
jgi:hypothetical protein